MLWRLGMLAVAAAGGGCGFPQARLELQTADQVVQAEDGDQFGTPAAASVDAAPDASQSAESAGFYEPGNDRVLATPRAAAVPAPEPSAIAAAGGSVTLNFENTSVLEVVKVILGDLLGRSYVIDPAVQGTVTLQSSKPLEREALLPTLEMLLRMNNAAVVDGGEVVNVVPREKAVQGRAAMQLGDSTMALPVGYAVRVVPLRYVSAEEMRQILEPLSEPGSVLRVDSRRNILILAGSRGELEQLLDAVYLFDVDWMAGMSVALFRPDFVQAETLAEELESVLGTDPEGPLRGLIRVVVIQRLNGLLVVTPRREYLSRVRQWVERLDQSSGGVGERLFVYHVQNGKAVDLAAVLTQVFEGREDEGGVPAAEVAPGLEEVRLAGSNEPAPDQSISNRADAPPPEQVRANAPPGGVERVASAGAGVALGAGTGVRIIPDEVNNALLILASAQDYKQVEAALSQLDIAPLQVLIEATIAEVTLTDQLSQGIEWFFKNSLGKYSGTGVLDLNDTPGLAALVPGFSYALTDAAGLIRAVINTLASESRAKIISSPNLMVLNNQSASIQVGDEVPIRTSEQQSLTGVSNVINDIEYRETGVTLNVTPRVNAGGLVTMEVEQDVSNVRTDAVGIGGNPIISQRTITSTVAVQSGETVVLGGLIRESDNRTGSGVPGLREVPLFGWFFGSTTDSLDRVELVVLITPRAVRGVAAARAVTEEFREKMDSLKPRQQGPRGFGPLYHKTDDLRRFLELDSRRPPKTQWPQRDSLQTEQFAQ